MRLGDITAIDPVCGMALVKEVTRDRSEYRGITYYFCGISCKEKFKKEPERYLRGEEEKDS